jgi:hypothetical protein
MSKAENDEVLDAASATKRVKAVSYIFPFVFIMGIVCLAITFNLFGSMELIIQALPDITNLKIPYFDIIILAVVIYSCYLYLGLFINPTPNGWKLDNYQSYKLDDNNIETFKDYLNRLVGKAIKALAMVGSWTSYGIIAYFAGFSELFVRLLIIISLALQIVAIFYYNLYKEKVLNLIEKHPLILKAELEKAEPEVN